MYTGHPCLAAVYFLYVPVVTVKCSGKVPEMITYMIQIIQFKDMNGI